MLFQLILRKVKGDEQGIANGSHRHKSLHIPCIGDVYKRQGLYLDVMNDTQFIVCGSANRSTIRSKKNLLYAIPTAEIAENKLIDVYKRQQVKCNIPNTIFIKIGITPILQLLGSRVINHNNCLLYTSSGSKHVRLSLQIHRHESSIRGTQASDTFIVDKRMGCTCLLYTSRCV